MVLEEKLKPQKVGDEIANRAAKWWADRLRSPAKLDNGDDSDTGMMTMMLGKMSQSLHPSELVDAYEKELASYLSELEIFEYGFAFGVDYNADRILSLPAEKIGLKLGMTDLPWKTTMWILPSGKITVAEGYRAETIEID